MKIIEIAILSANPFRPTHAQGAVTTTFDLPQVSVKASVKTSVKILEAIRQNPVMTLPELALAVGITQRSIERNIQNLRKQGKLRRIGPDKGGHWEIL